MQHDSQAPVVVASGPRGRGKTYWVREWTKGAPRVLALDPLGEYGGRRVHGASDVLSWHRAGGSAAPTWRLSVATADVEESDAIIGASWDFGPCVVIVEEADRFKTGGIMDCTPGLWALVQYGRHRGVEIVCATRRPANFPRSVTANASVACVFFTPEPADARYWREFLPAAAAAEIERLRDHDRIEADLWRQEWYLVKSS